MFPAGIPAVTFLLASDSFLVATVILVINMLADITTISGRGHGSALDW
jgi:hypothetical protein